MLHSVGADINTDNDYAFRWSCRNGHLKLAQWLHTLGVNIHAGCEYSFIHSCSNGHTDVSKWLVNCGVNVRAQNDCAFGRSCFNGFFNIAEWLLTLGADIQCADNYAFRYSCSIGRLDIAQWLYNHGANIYAGHNYAFRSSCENGHTQITKWLHEIDPSLVSVTVRDVKIPYSQINIPDECAILFEHIRKGETFPEIDEISDNVIISLAHYGMIDHLLKLQIKFPYIDFDIGNGKIIELSIKRCSPKNARSKN